VGCDQCHKGFAGRIGIFQVLPVSPVIADLILQEAPTSAIALQAQREGVLTLRQSGLRKVLQGITSLQEVLGATSD
jgi:type IV pilus assembly protein PilB